MYGGVCSLYGLVLLVWEWVPGSGWWFWAVWDCGRVGFGLVELFWLGDFGLLSDIILSLCTVFTGV